MLYSIVYNVLFSKMCLKKKAFVLCPSICLLDIEKPVSKARGTVTVHHCHAAICSTKFTISAFGEKCILFCSRTSKQWPGLAHGLNCMFLWGRSLCHCVYKWIRPCTDDLCLKEMLNNQKSRKKAGNWHRVTEQGVSQSLLTATWGSWSRYPSIWDKSGLSHALWL
jgi:hypothetical protein